MEKTEAKVEQYIHDHHLSSILLFLGFLFLTTGSFYISTFIFEIKDPSLFETQGLSTVLSSLLSLISIYGYPVLALILFLGYIGLPIPATGILLTIGALAATGQVSLLTTFVLVWITNILGNILGYIVGRKFSPFIRHNKLHRFGITPERMHAGDMFLQNWGMWCVFISHTILTPIVVPINVMTGIGKYSFKKFLSVIILAESIWTAFYLSLGFFLGNNLFTLINITNDIPKILTSIALGIFVIWIAIKIQQKIKYATIK